MQRARRLASIAVLGLLALAAFAGCRTDPKVAAYVGDVAFTQAQLDGAMREYKPRQGETEAQARQSLVSFAVVTELAKRAAADAKEELPALDSKRVAEALQLPPGSAYVELRTQYERAKGYLREKATPAAPDAEVRRELYDQLDAAGRVRPGTQFEQVQELIDSPQLQQVLGIRDLVAELVERYDVVVNPRYAPLKLQEQGVPIADGQVQVTVEIPVSVIDSEFVRDSNVPPPVAPPAPPPGA